MSGDHFDWTTIEDDVVIPEQAAIAVYNNPNGGVVCRQAGQYGPEEDSWIFFHPSHALALAKAILDKAGLDVEIVPLTALLVRNREGVLLRPFPNQEVIDKLKEVEKAGRADDLGAGDDQIEEPEAKKDRTATERKRRQREKQRERDIHGAETKVTATDRDIDGDTVTTPPLLPEFDLQNGGPRQTALTN
jgi:hypothetical protein